MKNNILQKINPLCQSGHARLLQLASSSNLSPYILKMNQNLAQGCIITWKMMLPFCLPIFVWIFQNCHALTEKMYVPSMKHVSEWHYQNLGVAGHMVVWWYITFGPHNTIWTNQKKNTLHKPWSKLVWPILQKLYGVHNSETVRNIRSIQESPKSVTLSHLQLWSTYQSPKVMAKSAWQSHRQTKQAVNRQLRSTEKTSHRKG